MGMDPQGSSERQAAGRADRAHDARAWKRALLRVLPARWRPAAKRCARLARAACTVIVGLGPAVAARLVRPVVRVRFGALPSARIGHYAENTEIYLAQRDRLPARARPLDLFFHPRPVCNDQLRRMWDRVLWTHPWAACFARVSDMLPGAAAHRVVLDDSTDRRGVLDGTPPHLAFTPAEEARGRAALRAMGVPPDAPFVAFHARDEAYLRTLFPDGDWTYHAHRNAAVAHYLPAARALGEAGVWTVRMGMHVDAPLHEAGPTVVDYATRMRDPFLDIWLAARCRFFLGCASGLDGVATALRVPVAYANYIPLGLFPNFSRRDLFIFKKLWLREEKRILTVREMAATPVAGFVHDRDYAGAGIEPVENSAHEIADLALEIHARLSGAWTETEADRARQARFWSAFRDVLPPGARIRPRVGAAFLRENEELLP